MALAPNREVTRLPHVAIDVAASEFREPIDRIEIVGRQIFESAGNKRLTLNYYRTSPCGPNGEPVPGSGNYHVRVAEPASTSQPSRTAIPDA